MWILKEFLYTKKCNDYYIMECDTCLNESIRPYSNYVQHRGKCQKCNISKIEFNLKNEIDNFKGYSNNE